MWSVKTIYGPIPAWLALDKNKFGKGLPKFPWLPIVIGFSYFQIKEVEINGIKQKVEQFVTSQISWLPTLVAVTPEQFVKWEKWQIIAKLSIFCWKP